MKKGIKMSVDSYGSINSILSREARQDIFPGKISFQILIIKSWKGSVSFYPHGAGHENA